MKNKTYVSSKNNGFEGQFKSLNNDEMISLKGGGSPVSTVPPIPSSGGEDLPLSAASIQPLPVLVISVPKVMPTAASNARS